MAREKTSEAKLQYVHFVRQKGTEMYNPSGICMIIALSPQRSVFSQSRIPGGMHGKRVDRDFGD